MNWQPHLKIRVSNGIQTHQHDFMKSDANVNEQIEAINKLKSKFKPDEKLTLSIGY